jgi:hypothetical protein
VGNSSTQHLSGPGVLDILTTLFFVGINYNMDAELLFRKRIALLENAFVEMAVWKVPDSVRGSLHGFKYRLALVAEGICVLRYDNETGKGDHKHAGEVEMAYHFTDLDNLQTDFWLDVELWRAKQ